MTPVTPIRRLPLTRGECVAVARFGCPPSEIAIEAAGKRTGPGSLEVRA